MRDVLFGRVRVWSVVLSVMVLLVGTAPASGADPGGVGDVPTLDTPDTADGLRATEVKTSLLADHHWFVQTHAGLDVVDGYLVRHEFADGRVVVDDRRQEIRGSVATVPAVSLAEAASIAAAATGGEVQDPGDLVVVADASARLAWRIHVSPDTRPEQVLVDAATGAVLDVRDLYVSLDGHGTVFDPNPVVALADPTLVDAGDADGPSFAGAYSSVTLSNLDGSGYLRGDYARIDLPEDQQPHSSTHEFDFRRNHPHFEHVMAYYHLTEAQLALVDWGFDELASRVQLVRPNVVPEDNSYYFSAGHIVLGAGGVDDGEDADVIWHEFGHALQHRQFDIFGRGHELRAIGEGFGDYLAVTMSQPVNGGYDLPCVADWDAVSYSSTSPPCLRRVDTGLRYADLGGVSVHRDGQIWSRALWDINVALGRTVANRIIIEAQYLFSGASTMVDAARLTVAAARDLYGAETAAVVADAFTDRGMLSVPTVDAGGPYTVAAGDTVPLEGTGSDPDGGEVTLAWDLDDDGEFDDATGFAPGFDTTLFGLPGENPIAVAVTDDEGQTAVDTATVTVKTVPTVGTTGPYHTVVGTPVELTATGEDADGGEVTYEWDLDADGTFETGGNLVEFVAGTVGTFDVTVRVTDDESMSATASTTVTVDAAGPRAVLGQLAEQLREHGDRRTVRAVTALDDALGRGSWVDDRTLDAEGMGVFNDLARAARELSSARRLDAAAVVSGQAVVLATLLVEQAADALEGCAGEDCDERQRQVERAQRALDDAGVAAADGDHDRAIKDARKAWHEATKSLEDGDDG